MKTALLTFILALLTLPTAQAGGGPVFRQSPMIICVGKGEIQEIHLNKHIELRGNDSTESLKIFFNKEKRFFLTYQADTLLRNENLRHKFLFNRNSQGRITGLSISKLRLRDHNGQVHLLDLDMSFEKDQRSLKVMLEGLVRGETLVCKTHGNH